MAICYPENPSDYLMTKSERDVYYALKNQLPDSVSVFYSISWTTRKRDMTITSEADFLIFDPQYGFLIVEVKGGSGIELNEGGYWYIHENGDERRRLDKSPYEQAERSMHYFKDFYQAQNAYPYKGVYGYVVMFPYFTVTQPEIISYRPPACTIDYSGMKDLKNRIREAFILHGRGKNPRLSEDQAKRFMNIVRKRIALSAAAGALIEEKTAQMERINRVQNNLIWFTQNYNKMFIKGGAGTGKTWICIKLAKRDVEASKDVMVLCAHDSLKDMIARNIKDRRASVTTLQAWVNSILGKKADVSDPAVLRQAAEKLRGAGAKRYDTIVIDEAQDFAKEWAVLSRMGLKAPDSGLYVFYDETQNIHGRDFSDGFGITNPPFILRENLRNTANIYKYATKSTLLGGDEILNLIEGPEPERREATDEGQVRSRLSDILDELTREYVSNESIAILFDAASEAALSDDQVGQWRLVRHPAVEQCQIRVSRVEDYKGLEADVVIYIHEKCAPEVLNYVAYTRARFYLYEISYSRQD